MKLMIRCVGVLLISVISVYGQSGRKVSFAEAKKLLNGEQEGNVENQPGKYSKTKLNDGRLVEIFYPLTVPPQIKRGRSILIPGYGLIHRSVIDADEAKRPKSMLEELMPSPDEFINNIPQLITRLEKRLGQKLDYSPASLKKIDRLITNFKRKNSSVNPNAKLFQEITAYYGEAFKRSVNGEWKIYEQSVSNDVTQKEPNISFKVNGKGKFLRPWSRAIAALFDDEKNDGLFKPFENDLKAVTK